MAPNEQIIASFYEIHEHEATLIDSKAPLEPIAEEVVVAPQQPEYPFEWNPLSKEEKAERKRIYTDEGPWCVSPKAPMLDLIESTPGGILMPSSYAVVAEEIYEMEVRPDDVFVVTYPKCGTTWTQEMVWQILNGVDLNVTESLTTRSPFLEMDALMGQKAVQKREHLKMVESLPSPRVIKTHLPVAMLPKKLMETAKVVFVARNPMDCCVSFFHHERLVPNYGFLGNFDQYAELFRNGKNPMGNYWFHLNSGWELRDHPNLKFIWFEDMKADLRPIIEDLCKFLGKDLTEEKIAGLQSHLHIDNFRKNKSVNMESNFKKGESNGSFIRKGAVGDWRNHFSEERVADWKIWVGDNTSKLNIELKSSL